jgi:hypothetical protein
VGAGGEGGGGGGRRHRWRGRAPAGSEREAAGLEWEACDGDEVEWDKDVTEENEIRGGIRMGKKKRGEKGKKKRKKKMGKM